VVHAAIGRSDLNLEFFDEKTQIMSLKKKNQQDFCNQKVLLTINVWTQLFISQHDKVINCDWKNITFTWAHH
jgi:hypothetical protein